MQAIAVIPGKPNSIHLREVPKPGLDEAPNGRGVLVKVLRVGVDGTDKEINAAEYGAAPPGDDYLILGHESFGVVEAVSEDVKELAPGDLVTASVPRPGASLYDRIGLQDMTTDDTYFERGINLRHGYLAEYYADAADYLVKVPEQLKAVGGHCQVNTGRRQLTEWNHCIDATAFHPRSSAMPSGCTIGSL